MSTENDKAGEASEETPAESTTPAQEQATGAEQLESAATDPKVGKAAKMNNATAFIILFFVLGFAASLVVGWVIFPKLLYSQKPQPIEFNHLKHNELVDNGCESCHFFRDDGSFSGVPKLAQCRDCHEEQQGESEAEAKLVKDYASKGIEIPWLVYSRQPDCVFFSHAAHVKVAEMECVTCHGEVGNSETLRVYEANRITGYSRDIWGKSIAGLTRNPQKRMKMDVCDHCHAGIMDIGKESDVEPAWRRLFTKAVSIVFPDPTKRPKRSSVQTEKEACFVCHK